MYYKELLRAARALRVLGMLLLVAIAIAVVVNLLGDGQQGHVNVVVGASVGAAAQVTSADQRFPLSLLFAIAGVVATIFAGTFGASLACENDGHLDVAFTRPASRTRYAVTLMLMDIAGIAVAFVMSVAAGFIIVTATGAWKLFAIDADAWQNLLRFLLLPVSCYGLWQALTASLRSQARWVVGVSVIVSVMLLGLDAAVDRGAWHAILAVVNYINPLVYGTYQTDRPLLQYPFAYWQLNVAALAVLGGVGIAAALAQWRRVEA